MSAAVASFLSPRLPFYHSQPVYRPVCPGHQMPWFPWAEKLSSPCKDFQTDVEHSSWWVEAEKVLFSFVLGIFVFFGLCLHKERVPRLSELPEQLRYPACKSQFFVRSVRKHIGAFTCQAV